jgi:ATP-dependent Clp protease ATP-binding subunit ClpC
LWPEFSAHTKKLIERAAMLAFDGKHQYIGTEHLLLAIIETPDPLIASVFKEKQVAVDQMKQQLMSVMHGTSKFTEMQHVFSSHSDQPQHGHAHAATTQKDEHDDESSDTPALDYFCTDLTSESQKEKLNLVVGRENEIDRLMHILARRSKNNPLLIGEPGVGKTAIVEGLARRIMEGTVPEILLDKRVVSLDLGLVLAGTMYRGEFESRFKQLIEELKTHPDCLLFIDEIHTIVGAGGVSGGTLDAANLLKPALARGELRCIGATTADEFRKHIENDPALERRFQPIRVEEPNEEHTLGMLQGLRTGLEEYHHVQIGDDVLRAAIQLSARYIPDRRLPDKAIDLIDEAGAKAHVNRAVPAVLKKMEDFHRLLHKVRQQKKEAVRSERYQLAVDLKKKEQIVIDRLVELEKAADKLSIPRTVITIPDVAQVVSSATGIPMEQLLSSGKRDVGNIASTLKKYVVGQDQAIDTVAAVLKRSYAGLTSPHRPLGSFLFLGPSGVGKTELAKVIATTIFGDRKALLRLDMSEFSEGFTVSKLIGAPAGYVGHKEGVKFIDHIRRKPYSVVLFDEIEKAHPDIFNLLLQLLDEGRLTDAAGREVNFRNTIIILTSNIGLDQFTKQAELGFGGNPTETKPAFEEIEGGILNDLRNDFPAEFLNRIDHHIVFKPLTEKAVERIVEIHWEDVHKRLGARGFKVRLMPGARALLAKKSFRPDEGARHVSKILTDLIENPLADKMMSGHYAPGDTIHIKRDKDAIILKKDKKA